MAARRVAILADSSASASSSLRRWVACWAAAVCLMRTGLGSTLDSALAAALASGLAVAAASALASSPLGSSALAAAGGSFACAAPAARQQTNRVIRVRMAIQRVALLTGYRRAPAKT